MGCATATHDIKGLFDTVGIPCNTSDWRLFIDRSSKILKAVLLHNTNQWPSIPLAHSVHMKKEHQNVKILLSALKYEQFNWEVIKGKGKVGGLRCISA